ncbi:hypothetical protein HYH03_000726 [Edaphochlamys debaryana]|uniref:Uncharacterized protein n=1 Tax=Edaphochlamys debaryana TaxID=47281 RepID=A0A836C6T6_9CHLO|nr:hypothetical protein HYH03_000726 [Edaphochlamys debaryana]|eukprot:KAG2502240.1 hypothetical protein HYH03_000726 [Edaphochlamys debaryana]
MPGNSGRTRATNIAKKAFTSSFGSGGAAAAGYNSQAHMFRSSGGAGVMGSYAPPAAAGTEFVGSLHGNEAPPPGLSSRAPGGAGVLGSYGLPPSDDARALADDSPSAPATKTDDTGSELRKDTARSEGRHTTGAADFQQAAVAAFDATTNIPFSKL